ncbi:MAG TPA: geranylgeranyl reductase family protein [Vicinamibacterales bacterium]
MTNYDAVICGAGPAGSIAAVVLARAGARVLLLDRARFPRDKLCGDTVNPGALAILERLGLAHVTDNSLAIAGMIVSDGSGVRCVGRYGGERYGRGLRRAALDNALLEAAIHAGAQFEERTLVQEPIVDAGIVRGVVAKSKTGDSVRIAARIVIAADGASSRLARAFGLSRHAARPRRWAVGAYFTGVAPEPRDEGFGEMHVRRGRYIGIAPMPDGLTNACVVTADRAALRDPAALLCTTVRQDPFVADRFTTARPIAPPVCLGPLAVENHQSGVPGLLLAGDAAGFIDPMTGDGLRFAFRGAELAAVAALSALESGARDPHVTLSRARRREFASKWRFNRTLRALVASPPAMRVVATSATWMPSIAEQLIRYAGDLKC